MTGDDLAEKVAAVATLRGIVRMAALVVMDEVGETDKALATAIAIKASHNLRAHLAAALVLLIREREAAAWDRALREAADGYLDCLCGHEIDWHHEERGCMYLGNGPNKCRCLRDAHTAVSDRLRDRAAANPYAGSEGGE